MFNKIMMMTEEHPKYINLNQIGNTWAASVHYNKLESFRCIPGKDAFKFIFVDKEKENYSNYLLKVR
jgi:predicted O-methyltransferase YrrM